MMYRTIRFGVFETNSSSMHSLVVTKTKGPYSKTEVMEAFHFYDNDDHIWNMYYDSDEMSFGRYPFQILSTVKEKTMYAIAEFCGYAKNADEEFNKIKNIIITEYPFITDIKPAIQGDSQYKDQNGNILDYDEIHYDKKTRSNFYYDKNGNRLTPDEEWVEEPYYGDVDHQSAGLLKSFLKNHNVSLKDFITNKEYVVIIDGDEYFTWDEYKKSGLINTDNIAYDSSVANDIWSDEDKN